MLKKHKEVRMENCKFCGWLLPLIIIIFTFWEIAWGKWVVLVAALIMFWVGASGKCCVAPFIGKPKKRKK